MTHARPPDLALRGERLTSEEVESSAPTSARSFDALPRTLPPLLPRPGAYGLGPPQQPLEHVGKDRHASVSSVDSGYLTSGAGPSAAAHFDAPPERRDPSRSNKNSPSHPYLSPLHDPMSLPPLRQLPTEPRHGNEARQGML